MSHTNEISSRSVTEEELAQHAEPFVDAEADSVPQPAAQRMPSPALRVLLGLSLIHI